MIQIVIIIIFICFFLLLRNYIIDFIFEEDSKKVVINENDNQFILFKTNDSVYDMKILNILYQCKNENDDEEMI
jgi:hypothetical protein